MANTLKLEIVTPEGVTYSEDVEMVTLPGGPDERGGAGESGREESEAYRENEVAKAVWHGDDENGLKSPQLFQYNGEHEEQ